MATFATLQQFKDRFERPLTVAEETRVGALLEDAADIIRAQVPGLVDPGPSLAVGVSCAMVARVIRNPEGKVTEQIGDDYGFRRDDAVASGELHLTEVERDDLIAAVNPATASGAFTITPVYPATS
ncbi:hypothetical protein [Nonomuraea sp. bgisy101]|uniref:hypothetical protein n=1 Tax=Nonomuraea sp. bgisy101 TaxID=3413784 RepID=UPI003D70253E